MILDNKKNGNVGDVLKQNIKDNTNQSIAELSTLTDQAEKHSKRLN
jgi:hypothetical protein